jgi:diacylglycerol kinase family enzyme
MKVSTLIHNPGAGAEKYNKEELITAMEKLQLKCRYSSTQRQGWKQIDKDTDFVIVAGGDGTVRRVAKRLLNKKILRKRFPIALLPMGTANNISKTLGIAGGPMELAKSWQEKNIKKFDVGFIEGIEDTNFFLEGFGYGTFPLLMKKMKKSDEDSFTSLDDEIKYSLKVLYETIISYEPQYLQLEVDGIDHSGNYLLAEIMNIRSIGPNLLLAPEADPGDGLLEVVLVPESQRNEFGTYVLNKLDDVENPFVFNAIKARSIRMRCEGNHIHVDDQLMELDKPIEIRIELFDGVLKFFVPD